MRPLRRAMLVGIVLAVPPFLVGNALLLMSHPWTADAAYALPGFPEPRIDLRDDERSRLAAVATRAIQPWRSGGIQAMRQARLEEGRPAFVAEEVRHFEDVRNVVALFLAAWAAAAVVIAVSAGLVRDRSVARDGMRLGVRLVAGAFTILGVFLLIGFDAFFEGFHGIFFEGDSWRLPERGTARSLYPDAFWVLMGGAMVALVLAQAAVISTVLRSRARAPASPAPTRGLDS